MSILKKHNGTEWKSIASNKATGISTESPALLNSGETIASVDDVLRRLKSEINTLKGNVSWLALHGGGGSGSGSSSGGTTITEATCGIKVNDEASGSSISMTSDGLKIELVDISVAATKSWLVIVRIGSTQVYSSTASYTSPIVTVPQSRISSSLTNHTGSLTVTASYEDDSNSIYGSARWSGTLYESVVNLTSDNVSLTTNTLSTAQIKYDYSVGIIGTYKFTINVYKDNKVIKTKEDNMSITETSSQVKAVMFSDLVDITQDATNLIGVYTLVATLQYTSNAALSISGTCTSTATIASDEILIAAPNMGSTQATAKNVYIGGSLTVDFTAYVQGASTYDCTITVGGITEKENTPGYFSQNFICLISTSGKSWAVDGNVVPIVITLVSGDKSKTQTFYAKVAASSKSYLELSSTTKTHSLVDFEAQQYSEGVLAFNLTSSEYNYGGSTLAVTSSVTLGNSNAVSGIQFSNYTPYLRIRNGAYGIVNNIKIGNKSDTFANIASSNKRFTLSICFKADYHPDDNRTILYCGQVDNATGEMISGISIDVHDIYINGNSVAKLTDNTINYVDISCVYTTTLDTLENGTTVQKQVFIIKVYLDGTLTAINKLDSFPTLGSNIYLGTRFYNNGTEDTADYLCDCTIYSLKLYDTALNDLDILVNYTNSLAYTSYLNGEPNYALIDAELYKNFAERNEDNTVTSHLYSVSSGTGTYTIDFLLNAEGKLDSENLMSYAKKVDLPIMLIDVSTDDSWTFNNFVTQQTAGNVSLGTATGRTIQYWDPTQTNNNVLTISDCNVELQGTSTLADSVKNINITVPTTTCFIPKDTWLPEQTYTLKADVVDSSHSNNASIGKFINEVLGYDETTQSSYYPFDSNAISNVYESDYKATQQTTATLKHTVEGFPILLIMKFRVTEASTVSVTPLGIYSFNLGRDAYRNLGFKKLNSIKLSDNSTPTIASFPYLQENVVFNESSDSKANWIEIKDTTSIADLEDVTTSLPSGFDSSKGDFWQNDDSILNARYEVRYPSNATVSSYTTFKTFVGNIMKLPIEGTYSTDILGNVTKPLITSSYNLYEVDNTNNYIKKDNQVQAIVSDPNTLPASLGFNRESMYKYFTIALFFGLVDNFGKNSTYRSWEDGDYFIDFYDLDTALGGSNQGQLSVDPDVWVKYLMNDVPEGKNYGYVKETLSKETAGAGSTQKTVSANHNKLWMSLDTPLFRQYNNDSSASAYTKYWNDFRTYLQETVLSSYNAANNTDYTNFADFFVDVYYKNQTGNCGSLLFNYDYKLKYLVQFKSEDDYTTTKDVTKLHGRKVAYTRDWLKKHILFLDSLFYWRDSSQTMQYYNNVATRGSNNVYNTPESFPIKTNTSLIIYNSVGNTTQTYYYVPKNTEVFINTGSNTSNSPLNWNFSNSPNIIQLGNEDQSLSEMNVGTLSHSVNDASLDAIGYPAITDLDLSGNTTFDTSFSLESFEKNNISEIRTLDFSNTSGNNFSLALNSIAADGTNYTKYTKLRKIDISNSSCITGLTIPAIPLQSLDVKKSAITTLTLKKQKYVSNLDLTGCNKLLDIDIEECDSYTNFNVQSLTNLSSVKLLNCPNLTSVTINNCNALKVLDIENCPKLMTITVKNCSSLKGDDSSTNYVTISGCTSLTSLDLTSNTSLSTIYITNSNQANITSLSLYNTKVTTITGDNADTSLLDLSAFKSLTNFDTKSNSAVSQIKFANILGTPIVLNNTFSSCSNLARVYGNVKVTQTSTFQGLSKFSIHGDTTTDTWHNGAKKSGNTVRMPYQILGTTYNNVTTNDLFQSGSGNVTNMLFTTCDYVFYGTNCTVFDMYYVVTAIQHATLSCNAMFYVNRNSTYGRFGGIDNSPNRYMFYYCDNVTSMNSAFRDTASSRIVLYSPTVSDGKVAIDNGLFSPLTNCTNVGLIWLGTDFVMDRYLFRRSDDSQYKITSIEYFNPSYIVDSVESLTSLTDSTIVYDTSKLGNLDGFFTSLLNLSYILNIVFNGTSYINYETSCANNNFKIPSTVTIVRASFNSTYAKGTIVLKNLFSTPANVSLILQSFIISSSTTGFQPVWNLNNDTFSGFTSLSVLGYDTSGGCSGSETITTLAGAGLTKIINQEEFPYTILNPCAGTITNVASLFKNAKFQEQNAYTSSKVELPGTLFSNTPKINNVTYLFYNFQLDYTLTSEGFANCTSLSAVDCIFGADTTSESHLKGSIPNKLFYHGSYATGKVTRSGLNTKPYYHAKVVDEETGETTAQAFWSFVEDETYAACQSRGGLNEVNNAVTTATIPGRQTPNANIQYCSGIFQRAIYVEPYEHATFNESTDIEYNPDYYPFNYVKDASGNWVDNTSYNDKLYTYRWVYDGKNKPSDTSSYDNPEDGSTIQKGVLTVDFSDTEKFLLNSNITIGSESKGANQQFMCAPDLLRYCKNVSTLGISDIFAYSGVDGHNYQYTAENKTPLTYGIQGRIVPYLLKPVSSVTNISGMFRNCKMISSYKIVGGKSYLIPRDFFSFTPNVSNLSDTFRGLIFPLDIDLAVFNNIKSSTSMILVRTFANAYYNGTSSNHAVVANVFNGLSVSKAIATFARQVNGDSTTAAYANSSISLYDSYVTFQEVFTKGAYTAATYNTDMNYSYVFAGHSSSCVTFSGECTLNTNHTVFNYVPYGGYTA